MNTASPKKNRYSRVISFGMLIVGAIFLCNPNINLFDLLPDAIGYGLFLLAIRGASEVFPHFDTAYKRFYTLFWINLAKFPSLIIMMQVTGSDLEERPLITALALSFAFLEWIFAIPAFRALFEGFVYIGEREGVTRTLYAREGKSVDSLTLLTLVFLIVKGALSFLPEMIYLTDKVNPALFYPVLAVFGFLVALVFGILWVSAFMPYLRALKKSEEMQALLFLKEETLKDKLDEKADRRRHRFFFAFLVAGFLFAIDPLIENADLLPNAFAALAFFCAFSFLPNEGLKKYGRILSLVYFAISVAESIFSARFFEEFVYTDVAFRDSALVRYIPVVATRFVESVCFLAIVWMLLKYLKTFTLKYTGHDLRPTDLASGNGLHAELLGRIRRFGILSAVYALLRPVCAVMMAATTRHVITAEEANDYYAEGAVIYSSRFAWLGLLILAVGIALAAYAVSLTGELKSEGGLGKDDE